LAGAVCRPAAVFRIRFDRPGVQNGYEIAEPSPAEPKPGGYQGSRHT
jgi:hypothetical protein